MLSGAGHHRRVGFLLFAAGWGANHFATLLIVYRTTLGLSASSLGFLYGAYALGLAPGLVLAGKLSDGRGRRALVLPASALAIGASLLLTFGGHGFALLLGGRLLYGLAMGSIMSPGSVWVQELSPVGKGPRRATLALSAGFGLGPLVSGVLAEFAPAPMVLPYLAHATAQAIALTIVRPVRETARPGRRDRLQREDVTLLLRLLPMAPWVFAFAAVTVAILPGILRPLVSRPSLFAGFAVVTTLFTGVLVQPLTARIGRRSDIVGLTLGIVGIALGATTVALSLPALLFVSAVFLGAGYGLVVTSGLREIEDRVPAERRGIVVGIYYVLTYVGFALPFLHAVAAEAVGDARALFATATLAVASLLLRLVVRPA
jgi:MFS family permease